MAAILDTATMLIPAGAVSTSQDFPAILAYPRDLPVCHWVVALTVPPSAAATFTLAVASTQAGSYSTIATLVWPAGTSGSKQVPILAQGLSDDDRRVDAERELADEGGVPVAGGQKTTIRTFTVNDGEENEGHRPHI
jgi:hypothetical protein